MNKDKCLHCGQKLPQIRYMYGNAYNAQVFEVEENEFDTRK